jgi:glycine cleavage system H protein
MRPAECRYTTSHEWIRTDGDQAALGITDYAAGQLGDITYVELPQVGDQLQAGQPFGSVESVKAVSDLVAPASGEVAAVNEEIDADPGLVNRDPFGEGWLVRIRPADPAEADKLLSAEQYERHLEELDT